MTEQCTVKGKCCDTGERTTEACYDKNACGCKAIPHSLHSYLFKDTGITTTKDYLHESNS